MLSAGSSSYYDKITKVNNVIQINKKRKPSLFIDNKIVYTENPKVSMKKKVSLNK